MELLAGRFEVRDRVAEGGMGVVHTGLDRTTGALVAIKRLRRSERDLIARLAREGEILESLEHPGIVTAIARGVDDDSHPYVVMPWLEGEDLARRLTRGPLSFDETLAVATSVSESLGYVHRAGLVHRDLKPSNLFLVDGSTSAIRLIDFGIARNVHDDIRLTTSGVFVGTPGYMAPEQARGELTLDCAADVFALGCVLFECLAGRPPFIASSFVALLAKVLLEDVPDLRDVVPEAHPGFAALVARMTRKIPRERPENGDAVLRALRTLGRAAFGEEPRAIGNVERRIVSVLVAVPKAVDALSVTVHSNHEAETPGSLFSIAKTSGIRLEFLPNGVLCALVDNSMASDDAAILARFGDAVRRSLAHHVTAIATGRALRGNRVPVGEAIERAFGLARQSEGDIAVDDTTASLLESRFSIQRAGAFSVIRGERASSDPTRPLLGKATPCLGRERELSMLDTTFAASVDEGVTRAVLVTASAGMGKSRLRHELTRRLLGRGVVDTKSLWTCRAEPFGSAIPYGLVAQIVGTALAFEKTALENTGPRDRERLREALAGRVRPLEHERIAAFIAELLDLNDDDPPPIVLAARSNPEAMSDQLAQAFIDLLHDVTPDTGAVLVVDDLQWSDARSVQVFDRLLRDNRRPLLLAAFARPDVRDIFPALWATRDLTEVKLGPLPRRAAERLVAEVLPEVSPSVVAQIVDRSEGSAFFLEELTRAAAQGVLSKLPDTMLAVAQTRLDRLGPTCRRVAMAASVLGETFAAEDVAAVSGAGSDWVDDALKTLEREEAIVRLPGHVRENLAFRHGLLQEAAYESLTEEDRLLGHVRAAECLERAGSQPSTVAIHLLRGAQTRRAAQTLFASAELHSKHGRMDAAADAQAVALWLVPFDDAEASVQRWRELALYMDAARSLGREAERLLSHAKASAHAGTNVLLDAVERAVKVAKEQSAAVAVEILEASIHVLAAGGEFARARTLIAEARRMTEKDSLGLTLAELSLAHRTGDGPEMERCARRVLLDPALSDTRRHEALLVLALSQMQMHGDKAAAEQRLLDAEKLNETPFQHVKRLKVKALCAGFAGDVGASVSASRAHVAAAEAAGFRNEEMIGLLNLGEGLLHLGDIGAAEEAYLRSEHLADVLGNARLWMHNRGAVAAIGGLRGDAHAAEAAERISRELAKQGNLWDAMGVGFHAARALAAVGRRDDARTTFTTTREQARQLGMVIVERWCEAELTSL